jgi:hypothetical protein
LNRSFGFTPFFLVYGAEAVLPIDIEFDAPRMVQYTQEQAKEAREDNINLLEEARELALSRTTLYQQQLRCYHSRKIRPLEFHEGYLVLRLVQNTKGMHKLSSPFFLKPLLWGKPPQPPKFYYNRKRIYKIITGYLQTKKQTMEGFQSMITDFE